MRYRMFAGAAGAVVLAAALTACSESADTKMNISAGATASATANPTGSPAAAAPFGSGCSSLPTDSSNPGSLESMAKVPVATAAAGNAQLSTLATAVTKAQLGDTLNNAEALTVFAPTNDAFAKVSQADLDAMLNDDAKLKSLLTYHVIGEKLTPETLAGTHKTLEGSDITVTGSGTDFTVDGTAKIVCGNIPTANATVYIVDGVFVPTS